MGTLATRFLLAGGILGPLFFIVVFLVEGATRTDYNPFRQPVSSLSIGDSGWMQIASFLVTGFLLLAFAFGVRHTPQFSGGRIWGPLLLGLVGIGLIGAGIFRADPLNGYPPGTPLVPTVRSIHGVLHDLFGVPVFLGLPIACFVFSRQLARLSERGWAIYSALTGFAMFVTFVLAAIGFNQSLGLAGAAGIFQRLSIIIGFLWITLLATHLSTVTVRGAKSSA